MSGWLGAAAAKYRETGDLGGLSELFRTALTVPRLVLLVLMCVSHVQACCSSCVSHELLVGATWTVGGAPHRTDHASPRTLGADACIARAGLLLFDKAAAGVKCKTMFLIAFLLMR
jgi:hypothetical protein